MTSVYLRGGIVVPVDGQHDWFDPGVVTFEERRITYVGAADNAPPPAPNADVRDCSDRVIMPGLVNTHTHSGMNYFRNLLEDLSSADWFAKEQIAEKFITREDVYWAALLGAYEMLSQGVTTIADRFGNMDIVVTALEHAGIRATIAPSLLDRDVISRQRVALDLLERYGASGEGLIHVGLGPVGPDTCSDELLKWSREQAIRFGALIFIHLAQSRQELAEIARRGYNGSARYLDALGVLGPNVVAAHCLYLDDEEIELLAARGVRVAHCPASNAKIEGRVASIIALERAGVRVGLGTDSVASNNGMDMFDEMKTAGLLNKVAANDATAMPVDHLLYLATQSAANCLDLGERIGSLQVGKRADVITIQRTSLTLQPWHDPRAGLVYAARGLDVQEVWVDGQPRVAKGALIAEDVNAVIQHAQDWAARYKKSKEVMQQYNREN